jgi:hypothetical protein
VEVEVEVSEVAALAREHDDAEAAELGSSMQGNEMQRFQ